MKNEYTFYPRRGYNGFYDLSENFQHIIQVPPQEFIDLKIDNKYYPFASEVTGTYQLIPFYQKISFPKDGQKNTSAFVIEKNPLNGEWQITEIKSIKDDSKKKVDGIYRKTIFTEFSIQENILKPLIVAKVFETLKKEAKEMKELSINLKEKLENNTRELQTLKIENKSINLTNKKNIQACETKLNNMNDDLQKIKSENKNLLEKYQNSRKTCSELHFYENENSALKRKVKNLDEKLKKAQQENQTQLNEYQKLEEEFQKLEKEFQNKESKFENLKTNLVAKENELNYLLNKLEQNAYIEAESQTECNSEENFKIEFSSSKSEIEKEFSELSTKSEIEKDTDTNQTQSSDKETSLEIQENVVIKKKKKRKKTKLTAVKKEIQNISNEQTENNPQKLTDQYEKMILHMWNEIEHICLSFSERQPNTQALEVMENDLADDVNHDYSQGKKMKSLLINYGALSYAADTQLMVTTIDFNFFQAMKSDHEEIESNEIKNWWRETGKNIFLKIVQNQYDDYTEVLQVIRKTLGETDEDFLKAQLFMNNETNWTDDKYSYDLIFFRLGYINGAKETFKLFIQFTEKEFQSATINSIEIKTKIHLQHQKSIKEIKVNKKSKIFQRISDEFQIDESFINENFKEMVDKSNHVITNDTDFETLQDEMKQKGEEYILQTCKEYGKCFPQSLLEFLKDKIEKHSVELLSKIDGIQDVVRRGNLLKIFEITIINEVDHDWKDNNYLEEFLYVHYGAIAYAIDNLHAVSRYLNQMMKAAIALENKENMENFTTWWKTSNKDFYAQTLLALEKHHWNLLEFTQLNIHDKKAKTLFKILKDDPTYFEDPKYEYHKLLKDIGYLKGNRYVQKEFMKWLLQ
jgi:hypothetical protein